MDIEPFRERLIPSISIYKDGGRMGRPVRVSIRSVTALHMSTRSLGEAESRTVCWSELTRVETSSSLTEIGGFIPDASLMWHSAERSEELTIQL
jgi:hypothetical protein